MIKFAKYIFTVFLLLLLSVTVFRWLVLFIFAGISIPFLFLTHIIEINFQNLSNVIELHFPLPKLNIYPTPFPIVYMNPKFIDTYKNFRIVLVYLADFLSFLFFAFLLIRLTPRKITDRIGEYKPSWVSFQNPKFNKGVIGFLCLAIILSAIIFQTVLSPAFRVYSKTKMIVNLSQETLALFKSRDFTEAKKKLELTKEQVNLARGTLESLSWITKIPYMGNYYTDVNSLFAAVSYGVDSGLVAADILPTLNSTSLEKIDDISPKFEKILNSFGLAKKEIDKIDPNRYPKRIGKRLIREKIILAKDQIGQLEEARLEFQPLLAGMPEIMGVNGPKNYLVLFQDENLLRPTGGTLTAFGFLKIDKGKIYPEGSGDIAELDQTISSAAAPPIISRYFGTDSFRLRDINVSPDFAKSMESFENVYQTSYQRKEVDGIIAIDGEFFVNLLKVLGPTPVYSNILTAENRFDCGCPGVIDDIGKLISDGKKKDIVGIFLNAMLVKSYSSPVKTQLDVFLAISKSVRQKHLLVYFNDAFQERAAERAGIGGRINDYQGDYLHINEANFTDIREDRFLKRAILDRTQIEPDGGIFKTVTLNYQKLLPAAHKSTLLIRFYLPKGTDSLEINGAKDIGLTSEDQGKTVIERMVQIDPQKEESLTLRYRLPFKWDKKDEYKLFRQKQPGISGYEYVLFLNGLKKQNFYLESDRELTFGQL